MLNLTQLEMEFPSKKIMDLVKDVDAKFYERSGNLMFHMGLTMVAMAIASNKKIDLAGFAKDSIDEKVKIMKEDIGNIKCH